MRPAADAHPRAPERQLAALAQADLAARRGLGQRARGGDDAFHVQPHRGVADPQRLGEPQVDGERDLVGERAAVERGRAASRGGRATGLFASKSAV